MKRASSEPWLRLFHKLRSTQEMGKNPSEKQLLLHEQLFCKLRSSHKTELLEEFPVHVVALWMGHDAKVSLKHYAQTTDEHFERATRAAESDAPTLQKAMQQATVGMAAIRRPRA